MPSPFPGMDPYIESSDRWSSFHTLMIASLCEQLNLRLPERFVASVEENLWVHEPENRKRRESKEPDVRVSERPGRKGTMGGVAVAAVAAPLKIVLPKLASRWRRYVKTTEKEFRQVVTALELL